VTGLERSDTVLQAVLAFYDGISTSDVEKFDQLVSPIRRR
jgi:hypothetical protein